MDNDQSYAPQLPVSKAFLVVVWLTYIQNRPDHQHYHRPPCHQGPRGRDCFNAICWNLWSYRLILGRLKGSHPMILTNPSVSVTAP